jgi:hypothetical protein
MGMDAGVVVWYGVRFHGEDVYDKLEERWETEERVEAEDQRRGGKEPYEWVVNDVELTVVRPSDSSDPAGFGAELFYRDWDHDPWSYEEMTRLATEALAPELRATVDSELDRLKVPGTRGVWVHTRYW